VVDPGSMYQLVVDHIHIDNQRDKDHDDDEMAISACIVGGQSFGTASFGVGSEIHTGADLNPPDAGPPGSPSFESTWRSPVIVLPSDQPERVWIIVNVLVNNTFNASGGTVPDWVKKVADAIAAADAGAFAVGQDKDLTKAWWTGEIGKDLAGLATALSNFLEATVVGLAVAELADLILGLFGTDRTCIGPVFEKAFIVPATSLDQLVAAGPAVSDTGETLSIQDGCGASPHTRITFRWVRRTDLAPPQLGEPAPKVVTVRPLAAARASSWAGSYGNIDNLDAAAVALELTAVSPDPPLTLDPAASAGTTSEGTTQVFRAPHVGVNLADRFFQDSGHVISLGETQIAVTQLTSPFIANQAPMAIVDFDFHKFHHLGGPTGTPVPAPATSAAQQQTVHFHGSGDSGGFTLGTTGPTGATATLGQGARTGANAQASPALTDFAGAVNVPEVLLHAQTLALSDGSTLQLYGGYAANGRWVENRIRYHRPASSERTETDLMLIPAQRSLH
jgi:hypothetical protein